MQRPGLKFHVRNKKKVEKNKKKNVTHGEFTMNKTNRAGITKHDKRFPQVCPQQMLWTIPVEISLSADDLG